ncbi:tape measure protein [Chitinophaga agrisoli]|uniref:Tape measure protein n=1 Tax=Chitinophaga agrisoli TaxID=2607653 RepID=A0A5B2VU95_9BACT|nr:tape measure protein [Chitinophaga agrisoli]KAA2242801.1 tape measure protein [Chitinophaga agrisoli]
MNTNVEYTLTLEDLLSGKLKNADDAAKGLESTMLTLGGVIGAAFGVHEVMSFINQVIEAGSKVENATTGLTTLLKDNAAAVEVVQNTMEDATKTPFAFESLLAANKALIAANVSASDAREAVLDLANAIAATGGSDAELEGMIVNLQGIRNVGKATSQDIKQFAVAGINIYEVLHQATGKSIEQIKEMDISYELLTQSLKKAHDEGGIYAGGLENMANNTSVSISNLEDATFQLMVRMFNDLKPAIDVILERLGDLIGVLGDAWDWSVKNKQLFIDIGEVVLVAAGSYLTYQGILIGIALWTKINVIWQTIQYASIVLLGDGMLTASFAAKLWAGAQVLLNEAMIANPIGMVIVAVGLLVAAAIYCYNHFGTFRAILWGIWEFMKAFFEWITVVPFKVLMAFGEMVLGALTMDINRISKGFEDAKSVVFDGAKNLALSFKKGYDEGMADFAQSTAEEANGPKPVTKPTGVTPPVTPPPKETTKVTGNKSVSINIKIDNLVKEFTVKTQNMAEGSGKVKEMVVQTLLSAVNDSQIVAGQ